MNKTYKTSTLDWGYCKDACALLAMLTNKRQSRKHFIQYTRNIDTKNKPKDFYVTILERKKTEFYGFTNVFFEVPKKGGK